MVEDNIKEVSEETVDVVEELADGAEGDVAIVRDSAAETSEEPKKMTLQEITQTLISRKQEVDHMKVQYANNLEQFKNWCNMLCIPEEEYTSITSIDADELSVLSSEDIRAKYPVVSANIETLEEVAKSEKETQKDNTESAEAPGETPTEEAVPELTSERMAELVLEDQAETAFNEDPVKTTILALNKAASDIKEWSKAIRDLQNQQEVDVRTARFLDKDYRERIVADEKASPELKAKAKAWLDRTKDIEELGPVYRKAKLLKDVILKSFYDNGKRKYAYNKFSSKFSNSENLLKVFTDVDVCVKEELRNKHPLFANFLLVWFACYSDRMDVDDTLLYCEQFASGYLSDDEEQVFIDSINKIVGLLMS